MVSKNFDGKVLKLTLTLMVSSGTISGVAFSQEQTPSKYYCEENRIVAEQAVNAATSTAVNANKVVLGGGVAGGCLLVSASVGFLDMGAMAAVCAAAGVLASAASAPDDVAARAKAIYDRYRDARCIAAYGK